MRPETRYSTSPGRSTLHIHDPAFANQSASARMFDCSRVVKRTLLSRHRHLFGDDDRTLRPLHAGPSVQVLHPDIHTVLHDSLLALIVEGHVCRDGCPCSRGSLRLTRSSTTANGYEPATRRLVGFIVAAGTKATWQDWSEPYFEQGEYHRQVGCDDRNKGFSGSPCCCKLSSVDGILEGSATITDFSCRNIRSAIESLNSSGNSECVTYSINVDDLQECAYDDEYTSR